MQKVRIAVVGDVHRHFTAADVTYFNQSDYDLILFVGDLANWWPREGLECARIMAHLRKPTLYIPGNHDAITLFQLLAEVKRIEVLMKLFSIGHGRRVRSLRKQLRGITWCGYSTHPFSVRGHRFDIIAARPFSMGGPHLGFEPYLKRAFGIDSMAGSAERLRQCVDRTNSDQIIFLAHNGPTGLGESRTDIWGNDFSPEPGDYGDHDLQLALEYAQQAGKRIVAVVAGHMHHRLSGGGQRQWHVRSDGIGFVNAARVPRIFPGDGKSIHHHVRLSFNDSSVVIEEMFVAL